MAAPTYNTADFVSAAAALLPRGRVWPRDADSVQHKTLTGLFTEYSRITTRCADLLVDAFPATASGLLPEWEATLGIPGAFYLAGGTTAERQAQVLFALTNPGGVSKAYFTALAASLGVTILITEYRPFNVLGRVNDGIYGRPWAFAWKVSMPASAANGARVQSLFRLFAPAHTYVSFVLT